MAGVGLDDEPYLRARLKMQVVAGAPTELHFEGASTLDGRDCAVTLGSNGRDGALEDIAGAYLMRPADGDHDVAGANRDPHWFGGVDPSQWHLKCHSTSGEHALHCAAILVNRGDGSVEEI